MSYYISGQANEKTYKLNNGHEVTFNYNDDGIGFATIEFMDAVFERLNNSVEVVRCKDCEHFEAINNDDHGWCKLISDLPIRPSVRYDDDYCSYGERAEA